MNKTSLPPQVIEARRLLEQEPHALAKLAKTVGWSPAYLQKQFVQAYGLTPAEFVSQQKFKNFKSELRKSGDVTRALYEAERLIRENGIDSHRQVIDVSGDGANKGVSSSGA